MHAASVLGLGHQHVCGTGMGLQRGDRPRGPVPSVTQGTTRGGCTRSPLPSLRQRPQNRHVLPAGTGRTCVPRWSRSLASWAASSPPSSSADSSPSSPGGWPPARSSPASSASTSTSTWQPADWGELGPASGHSRCPCSCLGWFPPLHVPVTHVDMQAGTFLPPALGVMGFTHPCQRGHRLLLPPVTTVPALAPLPLRAASLRPLFPSPAPRRDGGAEAPQAGLLLPALTRHGDAAVSSRAAAPASPGQGTHRGSPVHGGDCAAGLERQLGLPAQAGVCSA